eukprot:jgi/Chrzof1/1293/Cz10g01150.t1
MQKAMEWNDPYKYYFDRGLYFHEVSENLVCGTQPRNPAEVEELAAEHGVSAIVNLQQDKDFHYWGVDFEANKDKCQQLGVKIHRVPARDFDPHSLRNTMPRAVKAVAESLQKGDRVYVHCTAGLGRAPAVCIAYLYWFHPDGMNLDDAYQHVTTIRPCGPKRDAVRGATYDLLDHRHWDVFERLGSDAYAFLNDDDRSHLRHRVMTG